MTSCARVFVVLSSIFLVPIALAQQPVKTAAAPASESAVAGLDKAFNAKDWTKVVELGPAAAQEKPESAQVWHHYGYALHMKGRFDDALAAHLKCAEYGKGQLKSLGLYNAACVYALRKDKDKAFDLLDQSLTASALADGQIEGDTDLDSLRDDPRYAKLVEREAARAGEIQLAGYSSKRVGARLLALGKKAVEIHVEYGPIAWKAEYEAMVEGGKLDGKYWRFGSDFWTTFDTNVPVSFGEQRIEPGLYFLTLERRDGNVLLQFHDPAKVRDQRIDPFMVANLMSRPICVPMTSSHVQEPTKELAMALVAVEGAKPPSAVFRVDFGTYHLEAPMTVHVNP